MASNTSVRRLKDQLRVFVWRWLKNARDAFSYQGRKEPLPSEAQAILKSLRTDGIASSSSLVDKNLFQELSTEARRLFDVSWDPETQRPRPSATDHKGARSGMETIENKNFLANLTPKTLAADSVFLRYALQPAFISLANNYLGMNARMRAVHLWLNYPTDGEPASTQLFHRDGDDVMNLKIFTYLSDVGEANGPFTFVPGTQPLGNRPVDPPENKYQRVTDDDMVQTVPRDHWKICIGKAGDMIFADTCGYHRGLKPTQGYRLMLMVHYASRAAATGSDISLCNSPDGLLTGEQLAALA